MKKKKSSTSTMLYHFLVRTCDERLRRNSANKKSRKWSVCCLVHIESFVLYWINCCHNFIYIYWQIFGFFSLLLLLISLLCWCVSCTSLHILHLFWTFIRCIFYVVVECYVGWLETFVVKTKRMWKIIFDFVN